jgi:hypothetical protein
MIPQAAKLCRAVDEVGGGPRPRRRQDIGVKPAFLPNQLGEEGGVHIVDMRKGVDRLTGVMDKMRRSDALHRPAPTFAA